MLMRSPLARDRLSPPGFIRPCQAMLADTVPAGPEWVHEIKHDGFRVVAQKQRDRVRLWSRNGRDWSAEFTAIVASMRELHAQPFAWMRIDGPSPFPSWLAGGVLYV